MNSKLFNIGDIVALVTHPYFQAGTNIIISGDHMILSPLMVIREVHKSSFTFAGSKSHTYKYLCTWFSTRANEFIEKDIDEADLKLISKCETTLNKNLLRRGQKVCFKTNSVELGKKKSSLSHDDTSLSAGLGNTMITSLLTYLSPVLQIVDYEPHKSKHKLTDKASVEIRKVASIDVTVNYFDPTQDKIREVTLPLELLESIVEIDEKTLKIINLAIQVTRHFHIKNAKRETIIKPRQLAYRCGQYFVRGYDLLSNRVEEIPLDGTSTIKTTKKPVVATAPKFDIATNPASATPKFIEGEITTAISIALVAKSYIRIKYKNRNEKITHRTIKNYELIQVKEGKMDVTYLVGHCLLRHDKRSFRLDRIQNVEQLSLNFE